MLRIENKSDIAQIYISGDIIDDEAGSFLKNMTGDITGFEFPGNIKEQLDQVKDKELEIHINSCGGSVFAGVAISNFIANHKPRTTTIVDGVAASIASQIFFSADICKIPSNCFVMVHRPFTKIKGNAEDLRKTADILDQIQRGLQTTYQNKALPGVTEADITKLIEDETWLTGEDAKKYFDVKVLRPVKILNCVQDKDKLISEGFKNIPEDISFSDISAGVEEIRPVDESEDLERQKVLVKLAQARIKALIA